MFKEELIKVQFKLFIRNKRTFEIFLFLILWGITFLALFFFKYFNINPLFDFDDVTGKILSFLIMFIVPITFTSNILSFYYGLLKVVNSLTYNINDTLINIWWFQIMLNCMIHLMLLPYFIFNQEIFFWVSLVVVCNGIMTPWCMFISSLHIINISLNKSKTYEYSGISVKILLPLVATLFFIGITYLISKEYFPYTSSLPTLLGFLGILLYPLWFKFLKFILNPKINDIS